MILKVRMHIYSKLLYTYIYELVCEDWEGGKNENKPTILTKCFKPFLKVYFYFEL